MSGLFVFIGKDALLAFLGWKVFPLYSVRQGFCRTWVVRATTPPATTMVQHEFGLAHVTPAQVRRPPSAQRERQAQPVKTAQHKEGRSWAEIAASKPQGAKRSVSGSPVSPVITAPIPPPTPESSHASMAQAIAAALAPITTQMNALQAEFKALRSEPMEFEEFIDAEDDTGEHAAASAHAVGATLPGTSGRPTRTRKFIVKHNR